MIKFGIGNFELFLKITCLEYLLKVLQVPFKGTLERYFWFEKKRYDANGVKVKRLDGSVWTTDELELFWAMRGGGLQKY